jgi:RNA polymerase sigma-70 factor (ECF subfamily)
VKEYSLYKDEQLMNEIKAGNMLAFDALYNKYNRKIFNFAVSILKSTEDAENILQDVFLKLWLNRNNIEKGSSVRYYIFSIAYNSSITIIRERMKESRFFETLKRIQNIELDPVNLELEYKEMEGRLNEIIESLPARQKEVYILHKVEGLKYSEIAEKLNISVNTIENHMSRALKTIRERLGNYSLMSILFAFLYI